jgi:hypothetical protein
MMNSYWAILLDVTDDNDIITYGYTFRDRNMREAKLHAVDVCRRLGIIPLPDVWRISHAEHVRLEKYNLPTPMPYSMNEEEAA